MATLSPGLKGLNDYMDCVVNLGFKDVSRRNNPDRSACGTNVYCLFGECEPPRS